MILIVLGSVAAFFILLCAGCAWYEHLSQGRRGKNWFSAARNDWWDTSHVLNTPANDGIWDFASNGDGGFCGGDGGGGDCGGGDGGGGGD
jgi:hypothetical protein